MANKRTNPLPPNAIRRADPPTYFDTRSGTMRYGMPPLVTLADGTPYPPLTQADALTATEIHANGLFNADGTCMRYRRNGATQTWKTRPDDYRMPVKHGMRDYAQVTPEYAGHLHTPENCPFK